MFLLLIEVFTSLLSAAVINHNIGTGDLVILGTSTDDYIVTGSTNKHCIFVNFGYKGSITLQNCSIRYESTWGGLISPIRIVGQNNMSNTDQRRTNVNIILDGHNSIYNVGTTRRATRACIQVDQGAQINISAIDPCDNSSGTLVVTQENIYGGAGIGSRIYENNYYETSSTTILNNGEEAISAGGNIVISSGTIIAQGGHGAGIGGGHQSYFDGMIVIYGGIINVSSLRHAAGMGSGCPTGYGVLEEYTPNSAIVVVPPAEISAVGAGGDDGETLYPELGLAGTKVRVYIGDPGKPAINVKTIDNLPNANIYVDLSQHPDVLQTITNAVDSSKLNVNKILLGHTDANGVFSTTGSLTNSTTFFTDATNTSSGSFGRPYMPITQALADGGNITLPLLPTKINIFSKSSEILRSSYNQAQANKSATSIKIVYNDPYPINNLTFDLASGTSSPFSSLIFLASDSSTIVPTPSSLRNGDIYYILVPIKIGLPTKIYSDVLRISGTWKGGPTGYIRQVISQIVADIQTIHICEGSSYYFDGKYLTQEGIYTDAVSTTSAACATMINTSNTIKLVVEKTKRTNQTAYLCGNTFEWYGETLTTPGTYTKTLKTQWDCDSIVTLHLKAAQRYNHSFYDTICQGRTYRWEGSTYSTTGNYTKQLQSTAGCDSTVTLHLFVAPKYTNSFNASICQGESYTWEGSTYRVTGNYKKYLKSVAGCDSTVTLNLTVAQKYNHSFNATICKGSTYTWEGTTYSTTGNYTKHFQSVAGCDSTVTLHLTVGQKYDYSFYDTICQGSTYRWEGSTYNTTGNYTKQLQSTAGCDSTVTLNLTVAQKYNHSFNASICQGESYTWEGTTYTTKGNYTKHLHSVSGCDSIVTLNLFVAPKYTHSFRDTICEGSSYTWEGTTYTAKGNYTKHLQSVSGCDSTVTLRLHVAPKYAHAFHAKFCEGSSYTWKGTEYSTAGNYTKHFQSVAGCDSLVTMHLTKIEPTDSVEVVTICAGETHTWHGQTFSSSITTTETITNAAGCDSVCTLNLTILPALTGDTSATFCKGTPFIWHGTSYPTEGDYPYTYTSKVAPYCDSIVTLHLTQLEPTDSVENVTLCAGGSHTWHGQTFTTSTTITETIPNAAGCDSVCTLKLTVLPTLIGDTSATFCNGHPFKWRGVDYSIAGDYPYTYTSKVTGCDSIVTLHLSQLEPTDSVELVTICAGESHTWHGNIYTSTTDVTETITNADGCDSVCTLHLKVHPKLTGDTTATYCNGASFKWHGVDYTNAGDYQHTYTSNVTGCDSIVTLHLTQLEPSDSIEVVAICAGESHTWHGQTFTTSTTITKTISNSLGCDSVCTLQLTVLPALTGDTSATFCNGTQFMWHGTPYTSGGDYPYTYTSKVTGCDSIVTLHLSQLEPTDSVETVTICEGETHTWHGKTYTSTTDVTETITNSVGCDSVCTLHLKVNPKLAGDTTATYCNGASFKWHGVDYTNAGDYLYTYTSQVTGCDSIVTLHLSQLEPTDSVETVTICEGATHIWHGNPYISTTDITETITNAVGCDSICTLHLKVNPKLSGDTTASVCDGGIFTWWSNTYSEKGDYTRTFQSQITGCDSIVTLHLNILPPLATTLNESITKGATFIWNGLTYSEKGTYTQNFTTSEGCDSIVTLHLTVNPLVYNILAHIQCADDPFIEFDITASEGLFHQLQFIFTSKAIAQHFRDTIVDYSASQILIPNSARAGIYGVAVSPLFNNQVLDTRNIQFTLLYPSSVLDQHWDDFIGVLTHTYNGGYDFVGFQWYKNGQPMVGENHSYTYQPLEMGSAYSAMLEEPDGTKLMTCEIIATPQTEISIYPTLLQPHQIIRLYSSEPVIIWIYDTLGRMIYTNAFEKGDNQFDAPQNQGMYIIKIQQTGKQEKTSTKKLIVR